MRRLYRGSFLFLLGVITFHLLLPVANGFVSLKSLVLGDFSGNYQNELQDPLDDIYLQSDMSELGDEDLRHQLQTYRGFYEESVELTNFCKNSPTLNYANPWDRDQVKRSILSSLQYYGLDLTTRALVSYAKEFEFTKVQYKNLVDHLVGGYCSKNMSIISHKELKNNMMLRFTDGPNFQLPNTQRNPLFPEFTENMTTREEYLKREFKLTTTMFKSFCSWGGDTENTRMLVPLVRSPHVMSLIFRQMTSQKLKWNPEKEEVQSFPIDESVQVYCNGLICRRTSQDDFRQEFARSIGSSGIRDDLNRLYCEDFQNIDFQRDGLPPKIDKLIDQWTFDEQNFMVSHFLALVTKIPSYLLRAREFSQGIELARSSLDQAWKRWSKKQANSLEGELYFEESLTVELTDRDLYFTPKEKNFRVEFDVSLGEFDRINQKLGKLTVSFSLDVSKALMNWLWRQLLQAGPDRPEIEKAMKKRLHMVIEPQVQKARENFIFPPWKGDLSKIIVTELIDQVSFYETQVYSKERKGMIQIPVALHYGPFALKYIRHLELIEQEKAKKKELRDNLRRSLKMDSDETVSNSESE